MCTRSGKVVGICRARVVEDKGKQREVVRVEADPKEMWLSCGSERVIEGRMKRMKHVWEECDCVSCDALRANRREQEDWMMTVTDRMGEEGMNVK